MLATRERQTEAQKLLAQRELARRHFVDYEEYIAPYYRPARHHRLVGEYLEQVETYIRSEGKTGIGRLLIFEPPRHGKSEQGSKHFPTWVLGRLPDTRIALTSYGLSLATKFSRAAREIVEGTRFAGVFGGLSTKDIPVEISSDSRSVEGWDLAAPHRGGMIAAGVGGGLTGSGAHLLVVDDPFKNREEAESEARRELVWEWWTSTAYTRLEKGGAVIGSLTRWNQDDWAGRLLKAMANDPGADRYVVVCLMALWEQPQIKESPPAPPVSPPFSATDVARNRGEREREKEELLKFQERMMREGVWVEIEDPLGRQDGAALWTDKYNEEDLERIKANVGSYDWEALYQQRPYSRTGNMFKEEWFAVVDTLPRPEDVVARIRVWDKAGSKTGIGDYSTGVRMSLTRDDVVYVEHVSREMLRSLEREQEILRCAREDVKMAGPVCPIWHQQDPGSAGLDSAQLTNLLLAKNGFTSSFETMTGDKVVRAGPWSSICQAGRVRLVQGPWVRKFIDEHVAFPKGAYDDQVDCASWGYSKLVGLGGGSGIFV